MPALGLGIGIRIGLLASTAGPSPSIPTIGPSGTWTGTAGSGYGGSPPTDPVRTTAKPMLRPLFVENDVFISDRTIVVDAMATAGVTKVRFYCEGNTVDVTSPRWVPYTDVNGVSRLMYGYAVTLDKAAFDAITASGTANIYAEAYPTDGALQNRVIGPFRMHNRATLYAGTRTVAPSGADHTTIVAALNWITTNSPSARNYRIQITASGDYALNTAVSSKYDGATHWVTIEAAGGVTASITSSTTRTNIRPQYDGLRFKGSGIVLDHAKFSSIVMESTGTGLLWIDGCTIQQTGGKFAVFDGIFPQSYWMSMSSGTARNFYATDCSTTGGVFNGFSYCNLALNCYIDDISSDAFQNNKYFQGLTSAALSPSGVGGLRTHLAAIDLTYTGAGVPKIAISGSPNTPTGASTRTLQCYVDGVAVGTALTITNPTYSPTGSGYTTWATVAAHIDALADFGATVNGAAGTRRAISASKAGLTPTDTLANGTGREITFTAGAAQMTSIFDVHSDLAQYFGNYENYGGRFMSGKQIDGQGFFVDGTSTTLADCQFSGIEISSTATGNNTQFYSAWSHSSIYNLTACNQDVLMRIDGAGAAKFNPDTRCKFSNFSCYNFRWATGTPDADLVIDRVNVETGTLPTGTTNGTTATTNLYVSAPSDLTPVTGGNLLVSGTYLGARQADGTFNV
jgi:hypothetical protein